MVLSFWFMVLSFWFMVLSFWFLVKQRTRNNEPGTKKTIAKRHDDYAI